MKHDLPRTAPGKIQKPVEALTGKIICGDALKTLEKFPDQSIDCVVTSPPYWALRDYGAAGQIGLESTIDAYLDKLLAVFAEIKRALKPEGTCWVNYGDTYSTSVKGGKKNKPQHNLFADLTRQARLPKLVFRSAVPIKSLCLIPSRFALRMLRQGWILRNEIIWHKPNCLPQSARDRFTVDFEKLFFFVKSRRYFFRQQFEPVKLAPRLSDFIPSPKAGSIGRNKLIRAMNPRSARRSYQKVKERGRNKRAVWTIPTGSFLENHYAVYPPRLVETPILAGCPPGGIVLDPFAGSGTTALVAKRLGRRFIGIELNPQYVRLAKNRIKNLNQNSHNSNVITKKRTT